MWGGGVGGWDRVQNKVLYHSGRISYFKRIDSSLCTHIFFIVEGATPGSAQGPLKPIQCSGDNAGPGMNGGSYLCNHIFSPSFVFFFSGPEMHVGWEASKA